MKRSARDGGMSRFLLLYALAHAGGVIAYMPLLTLLLPIKVAAVAGPTRIGVLTAAALAGAVAASLANIGWGWASDRSRARGGSRRGWVALGLVGTALSYGGLLLATTALTVVVGVVAFQVAVNAILAPLAAMLADAVPDERKGIAGGLLVLANPLASLVTAGLVAGGALGDGARYGLVCVIVALLVAPLLVLAGGPTRRAESEQPPLERHRGWRIAWVARLLAQVAGNVLSIYLLYYFASVAAGRSPAALAPWVGQVQLLAYAVPLPIALAAGRLSDRWGRRVPFLVVSATLAAGGLATMAWARGEAAAVIGFGCYACGSAVFLALHNVFAMQMLPSPATRGRDLGVLNLTNTLPALIGPALTWSLATADDFRSVMLLLAGLTLAGGLLMLRVGDQPLRDQPPHDQPSTADRMARP